jgi:hypothetical protein
MMRPKSSLVAYLALMTGLFLVATLAGFPTSLAAGPPPTGTPQVVKSSYSFPLDLATQPISQPVRAVHMPLGSPGAPTPSGRSAATLTSSNNGTGWQKIMAANFEGGFPPPNCFVRDLSSGDGGEYLWGKRDCKPHSGGYSIWAGGGGGSGGSKACGDTYANNLQTWLTCGPFDLSQATDAELQFALWADAEEFLLLPIDFVFWGASTDAVDFFGAFTAGQTGNWIPGALNLAAVPVDEHLINFTGEPQVYLGWLFDSNEFNLAPYAGALVDDVALWTYEPPSPPPAPPSPTLPITIHTTITDFMGGRSGDMSVSSSGEYGDGALKLSSKMTAIGNWERLPSLPRELFRLAAVTAQNRLFVIGGSNPASGQQKRVYSALIGQDGHLGGWQEVTSLPQALSGHSAVVANDHLFVLGGGNANGVQATVFSARINDDGTLGLWTELPALPDPLVLHTAVSTHGYIYVLGGRKSLSSAIVSDAVHRARVNANGTLGTWETLPITLPRPLHLHAAVATCDHVYVIGGQDAVNEWDRVYQAEIQADGELGAWSETTSLPKTLVAHPAVAVHGGILVAGGFNSSDPVFSSQRSVYWAPLGPDCTLGSWLELTPLPYNIDTHALAATEHYVYSLGGLNATSRAFASVLMAPLQFEDSSVQHGSFNHQFYLGKSYTIETLHWTEEGSGGTDISLRYRVGNASTGAYGPWSDYTLTHPIPVNATGGYLEYQLKFAGGNGLSDKRITEVSLSITPLGSVYLPLVVKD